MDRNKLNRQPDFSKFNLEELLELIAETDSLGAAHRMAKAAIARMESEREEMLLVMAERHAEQTAFENGYGM